jgi:acetyl esterase/lipase
MLLGIYARAKGSREIVEAALVEGLGADYRTGLAALLPARLDELDRPPALREQILPFVPGKHLIERTPNLPYGPAGWRNHLDIYRRKDRPAGQGRAPVLVNVHGGAWIMGDKDRQAMPLIHHLASLGWVCVAINYRLSPRGTFPDHIVDVKRALAWVKAHIAEYGGDPDFVVLSGGSAGGHLCSLATLSAGDPAYQPGFEDVDLRVQACVPFYGVYDFTNRTGNTKPLVRLLERTVVKKRLADARDVFDKASPMSRVNAGAPPFLVIHGTNDTLVPVGEARLFVELLRKASRAPVVYVELPEAQHAFEVWSSARTAHVIRGVARFLAVVHQRYETEKA